MRSYEDIIDLPYPYPSKRRCCSAADRAAQFCSFAALTGFDAEIDEEARYTAECIEQGEEARRELDEKQALLLAAAELQPQVTVTFFRPDKKKSGGAYINVQGRLKRIDEVERLLCLCDGTAIPLDTIIALESDLF